MKINDPSERHLIALRRRRKYKTLMETLMDGIGRVREIISQKPKMIEVQLSPEIATEIVTIIEQSNAMRQFMQAEYPEKVSKALMFVQNFMPTRSDDDNMLLPGRPKPLDLRIPGVYQIPIARMMPGAQVRGWDRSLINGQENAKKLVFDIIRPCIEKLEPQKTIYIDLNDVELSPTVSDALVRGVMSKQDKENKRISEGKHIVCANPGAETLLSLHTMLKLRNEICLSLQTNGYEKNEFHKWTFGYVGELPTRLQRVLSSIVNNMKSNKQTTATLLAGNTMNPASMMNLLKDLYDIGLVDRVSINGEWHYTCYDPRNMYIEGVDASAPVKIEYDLSYDDLLLFTPSLRTESN